MNTIKMTNMQKSHIFPSTTETFKIGHMVRQRSNNIKQGKTRSNDRRIVSIDT